MISKPFFNISFCIHIITLYLIANQIAPTNRAGPGLDAWVLLIYIIALVILSITTIKSKKGDKRNF